MSSVDTNDVRQILQPVHSMNLDVHFVLISKETNVNKIVFAEPHNEIIPVHSPTDNLLPNCKLLQ